MSSDTPTTTGLTTPTGLLEGPERLVGTRVLDFELTAVLGAGGMSVVYRGRHRVTGHEVAVKVLPPELAIHDELKARFVEEARLLAMLEHANIVTLNNFTETSGRLCLIMQYVEGVTFEHQLLERGHVPWRDVVRVGVEVCKALEHAHQQGIIHRDIKPSNVLVRSDGSVKVTDFGIAKMVGQSRLTSTGQTMGTVRYMSPEQVRGRPLDVRSDVYSLGVTLFEGLAGKTPFDGDNQFAIMEQHLHRRPPPLASFGAEVPPEVERVLLRSLEKKATDRFADAASFREALEALSRGERPSIGLAPSTRRSRRLVAAVVGLAVLGAGLGVGVHQYLEARRHEPAGVTAPPPRPPGPTTAAQQAGAAWPEPHALADVKLMTDRKLDGSELRLQAMRALDPAERDEIEQSYRAIRRELSVFLAGEPAGGEALRAKVAPLNLVVVADWVLNDPKRWPRGTVEAGRSYGSRYIETRRTLFVADGKRFLDLELPYGVALHVLAPIDALSTATCNDLAERFAAYHLKAAPKPPAPR